jgi:hypothetical protein
MNASIAIGGLVALITAAVLLSQALGWQLGVGITALVWFHKPMERA